MITQAKDKGSKTVHIHLEVYKELRDLQNKYYTAKNISPSFSEIVHDLITKNKKYRRMIKEFQSKEIVTTNEGNINTNQNK